MENPTTFQVHYGDFQRQMARANTDGWKFNPPTPRRKGRLTVAKALIALAALLVPTTPQPRPAK